MNVKKFFASKEHKMQYGSLSDLFCRVSSILPPSQWQKMKKAAIVACGDHGIAKLGISAYPPETTVQMTENYLKSQGAVANAMSKYAEAELYVVDVGIAADMSSLYGIGLIDKKIGFGTSDFTQGAAMTRAQAEKCLVSGRNMAQKMVKEGVDCFLLGEMGIGNTSSSAAMVSCFCQLSPEEATGRGTNISDEHLKVKVNVVKEGLLKNRPDAADGIDVLSKVGGFEFGFLAGIILGAHECGKMVVLDGFNTAAAALIAQAVNPACVQNLLPSHISGEPAHRAALFKLGFYPYFDLGLKLSEMAGSAIVMRLLAMPWQEDDEGVLLPQEVKDFSFAEAENVRAICQERIDNLTKPLHSLGELEKIAADLAVILRKGQPTLDDVLKKEEMLFDYEISCRKFFTVPPQSRKICVRSGRVFIGAALAMLNDMKTFKQAGVSVANDGPGALLQKA